MKIYDYIEKDIIRVTTLPFIYNKYPVAVLD